MTQLTRLTNLHLLQRKQAASPKVMLIPWLQNITVINALLLALLLICGLLYLAIVNSTAADNFQVYDLTKRIQTTRTANQHLELDISEALSLSHVNEMSRKYDLVTATNVQYLNAPSAVALSD